MIVGFSGKSGSGKTTLIEKLIPRLKARGLRVAAVKHCPHHLEADRAGKDSDRLFRAGAGVVAAGREEAFVRIHAENPTLAEAIGYFTGAWDVVLVEGFLDEEIPRIHLATPEEPEPRAGKERPILLVLDRDREMESVENAVLELIKRNRAG